MKNCLIVTASPRYSGSHSRMLADKFVSLFKSRYPQASFVHRDLVADSPPMLTNEMIHGFFRKPGLDSRQVEASLTVSDRYTHELLSADFLVIATPMYNFNVPATLKSWIDLVVRSGLTFEKVADGQLRGLCKGKKAVVLCSMGGWFAKKQMNLVEPYLRLIADFIGLESVEFVYLEGTATSAFNQEKALLDAEAKMKRFVEDNAA